MQAQQALAVKDQQKASLYSHWSCASIQLNRSEARSPTSTSPPTPLAVHPEAPTSQRSSQDSVSSPVRRSTTQFSFPGDNFPSPVQSRPASQVDQPAALSQSKIGGRSPGHHLRSNGQSPIGSQLMHRKSSSMDSSQVPVPSNVNGFGHGKAAGGSASKTGRKPSPRSQHAQHAMTGPCNDGPIANLLGLNQNEASQSGLGSEGSLRSLRPSKSLQDGSRSELRTSAQDFDPTHLLPRAIHDLANGHGLGMPMSMLPQGSSSGHQTNRARQFGYAGSQNFSQHADAFQRQLQVSSSRHV